MFWHPQISEIAPRLKDQSEQFSNAHGQDSIQSTLCYLDDVLIFPETFDQHLSDLQEIFARFRAAGLKLSPGKDRFAQSLRLSWSRNFSAWDQFLSILYQRTQNK